MFIGRVKDDVLEAEYILGENKEIFMKHIDD